MTAPCQHFGQCGGCKSQDIPYEQQLAVKEEFVKKLFGFSSPITRSPLQYHYRNRMDFAFGPDYSLGLKAGKFEIINVEKCWLVSEEMNQLLELLRSFMRRRELKGYIFGQHDDKVRGPMRHAVIREGVNIKNRIINIITADKFVFPLEELWAEVKDQDKVEVQGITWSINLSPADRSFGEIQKTVGQDYYWESLAGLKFKVPVQAFFQTNTHGAEKLLEVVKEFVGPDSPGTLLDLYSGTGSLGLSLAKQAKLVIGIEENAAAVELSRANAQLNGIENYLAIQGQAEKILPSLNRKADIAIVDPPRPGLHQKALKALGEMNPRKIVYVSCNPATQRRDVDLLKEFGYEIKKVQPLDLFPHTPHVENIIQLMKS